MGARRFGRCPDKATGLLARMRVPRKAAALGAMTHMGGLDARFEVRKEAIAQRRSVGSNEALPLACWCRLKPA